MENKLVGIFAPINIPFTLEEEVDFNGLTNNLQFYLNTELSGLLLLGSNAENKSLTDTEKFKITELATSMFSGKKTIIVGLMVESLYLAKQFVAQVKHLKIDFLLVQPPFYFRSKTSDDDYYRYYAELAKVSPFPILLYNAPGFTGVDFSEQLINRLADEGIIVGIKDSSKYEKSLSSKLSVLTGTANTLFPMLEKGATGGVVSLANFLPELPVNLYKEYVSGNRVRASKLQETALTLNSVISGKSGVAGVKAAMDAVGLCGGNCREPLQRLPLEEIAKMKVTIEELYP